MLTPDNGMTLGEDAPSSAQLAGEASVRQRFYNAYRCDATMLKMDAVVCSHPVAACEIYLPLDLPIILYVTTRFDLGRLHSADALRVLLSRSLPSSTCNLRPLLPSSRPPVCDRQRSNMAEDTIVCRGGYTACEPSRDLCHARTTTAHVPLPCPFLAAW